MIVYEAHCVEILKRVQLGAAFGVYVNKTKRKKERAFF